MTGEIDMRNEASNSPIAGDLTVIIPGDTGAR